MNANAGITGLDGDDLRDLKRWLGEEPELKGAVDSIERAPVGGELSGAILTGLAIALAPGGVAAVIARSLLSWLRHKPGDLHVVLTRGNGDVLKVTGRQAKGASLEEFARFIADVAKFLDERSG